MVHCQYFRLKISSVRVYVVVHIVKHVYDGFPHQRFSLRGKIVITLIITKCHYLISIHSHFSSIIHEGVLSIHRDVFSPGTRPCMSHPRGYSFIIPHYHILSNFQSIELHIFVIFQSPKCYHNLQIAPLIHQITTIQPNFLIQ